MNVYGDFVYASGTNNPMPGVAVSVMIANTQSLAVLYDSVGNVINNPVTTDQTGFFQFYAAAGVYDIYALGTKYYEISLSGNTSVQDPLTLNSITANQSLTVGKLLTGDMSSAGMTGTYIQTNVVDGNTFLEVFPNGTASRCGAFFYANSDPTNSQVLFFECTTTLNRFFNFANNAGVGPDFEITMETGPALHIKQATRNVLINTTTDDGYSKLQVSGAVQLSQSAYVAPITLPTSFGLRVIGGTGASSSIYSSAFADGIGAHSSLNLFANTAAGDFVLNTTQIGIIRWGSFANSAAEFCAALQVNAEENHASLAKGSSMRFSTCSLGAVGYSERMRITPSGSLYIGQTASQFNSFAIPTLELAGAFILKLATFTYNQSVVPAGSFWLVGDTVPSTSQGAILTSDTATQSPIVQLLRQRSTGMAQASDCLGKFLYGVIRPSNGGAFTCGGMNMYADTNFTEVGGVISGATSLRFSTQDTTGTALERMRITPSGQLWIGTTSNISPANAMLQVNGDAFINGALEATSGNFTDTVQTGLLQCYGGILANVTNIGAGTTALQNNHYFVLVDTTAGSATLTLPLVSPANGQILVIKRKVATNTVTINRAAADLIENPVGTYTATTMNMAATAGATLRFVFDTGVWYQM